MNLISQIRIAIVHLLETINMDVVYSAALPIEPLGDANSKVRERLAAKKELWDCIHEMAEEMMSTTLSKEEMIKTLCRTCITILHPHFTGAEIARESHLVVLSFNYKTTYKAHTNIFKNIFFPAIINKMKAATKNKL